MTVQFRLWGAELSVVTPRWTAIIAASLLPALGALDVLFAYIGGNRSTFSAVLLRSQTLYYYLALCIGYGFGLFMGHVFFPSEGLRVPPGHEMLARLLAVCWPILCAIVLLASGEGRTPTADQISIQGKLILGSLILASVAAGMFFGAIGVPQHPLAWAEE